MASRKEKKRRERAIPQWYLRWMMRTNRWTEPLVHLALHLYIARTTLVLFGGLFAYRRLSGYPIGFMDWLCFLIFAMPLLMTLVSTLTTNIESKFELLNVRGRWDELLRYIPVFRRKVAKALGEPRADHASLAWSAKALTRLGRDLEADDALEQIRLHPDIPEVDYLITKGTVLGLRQDYEAAREVAQQIIELAPERAEGWLAACEIDAIYLNEPDAALLAYEQAQSTDIWQTLGQLMNYIEGAVLAMRGEHPAAIETLEKFRKWARGFAYQQPNAWELWAIAGCIVADSERALERDEQAQAYITELKNTLEQQRLDGVMGLVDDYLRYRATSPRSQYECDQASTDEQGLPQV